MTPLVNAREPFRFYTRLHLAELIGLKASTIGQLLDGIKQAPPSCIYHHTHRFLQQHRYLSPEPPNDFAYWVSENLGEDDLGELLASIDIMQFSTIENLRAAITATIEDYLKTNPSGNSKSARKDEEFYFIKSISFILPSSHVANNLADFIEIMREITVASIYFHIFEARLRLERKTNDFSNWIENSLNNKKLADKLEELDPYTRTIEGLRSAIIDIAEKGLTDEQD